MQTMAEKIANNVPKVTRETFATIVNLYISTILIKTSAQMMHVGKTKIAVRMGSVLSTFVFVMKVLQVVDAKTAHQVLSISQIVNQILAKTRIIVASMVFV